MRYHDIKALVEGYEERKRKNPKGKPLENNTYAIKIGYDRYAVRLHATDIVVFNPDGTIELHTGGWQTVTTKDRMNKYAGVRIWQQDSIWFISVNDNTRVMFHTGMVLRQREDNTFDQVNTGRTTPGVNDNPKNVAKTKRNINAYIDGYIDALMQGQVPTPSGGDCWLCLLDKQKRDHSSCGHILSHIDEMYFVPSLSLMALEHACAETVAIAWVMSKMRKEGSSSFYDRVMPKTLKNAMRKLMYKYIGVAY